MLGGEVLVERRVAHVRPEGQVVQARVPAVTVVGVVAGVDAGERIDRDVVDVARADGDDLEVRAVGAHAHDRAAAVRDALPVGADRLHVAVVADGDVQPAIRPELDVVRRVIGAAEVEVEAEPLHEIERRVGDAVTVRVAIGREVRRVHHVDRLPVRHDAARAVHLGVGRVRVGAAVAVGIDEAHHAPDALERGEREVRVDADEHRAVGGLVDAGGIHRDRRAGEERDVEVGGRLERRLELLFGGGLARHLAALGNRRGARVVLRWALRRKWREGEREQRSRQEARRGAADGRPE